MLTAYLLPPLVMLKEQHQQPQEEEEQDFFHHGQLLQIAVVIGNHLLIEVFGSHLVLRAKDCSLPLPRPLPSLLPQRKEDFREDKT
jgi:hypothetical protein